MSLEVYFDNTLIDEKYYTGLTNNFELFNENFKLGTTPSNIYTLKIAKEGVINQPTNILLRNNGTPFAELEIDNIEEQDYEYVYTLTDKMLDLNFYYDASEIFQNGSTTLLLIVQDICDKVGLTLGTVDFRGYNKVINWYDNTRTAREYIGFVAELNGGFARIENNTLYFYKQKRNSAKTIDIDECEDFNIGEYHKITRVVYELGALKYEFGDETGNTLYLNADNVYITEESEVEAIYNDIKDFEFYSFSTNNCPIDYNVKAGDIITFTDGVNTYPTIAQYDLEYYGDWIGGYNLDINTERQEETQIIGDKEKIKNIQIIVDRQNNTITQVVSEVDEQNTKIAQTQQSVNELNSKIQDLADITTQAETIYASLDFTGINQSEPIEVKIHPTITNISYLYPRDNLYPSNTLYMTNRILRFTNTDTNEVFDYELPDNLLINSNTGTYDEFYLGYDEQICQVTKRCKYNADGTISDLTNEVTTQYTYPSILLTDGDYTIELLGYNNGYMSVRLMTQNIYTTQFATKAEVSSEISQTADSITSTVAATYETKQNAQTNYSQIQQTTDNISSVVNTKVGENEVISKINQSAEAVSINANKINLNGAVTANNNFKIKTDGSMEAVNGLFTGGKISLTGGTQYNTNFEVKEQNGSEKVNITPGDIFIDTNDGGGIHINSTVGQYRAYLYNDNLDPTLYLYGNGTTRVKSSGITTPSVTQTSIEENKKNFELLQNGLDIIKNTNIYKYNLKTQKDGGKKHIGFVIGKDFKYRQEITSENNDGVDTYSMISVAYKAIQEQQEEIEQLQKEIKELKGE